jgi:hypothetical protein
LECGGSTPLSSLYCRQTRVTFHAYREELPFELVETFVQMARQRLPPVGGAAGEEGSST